MKVKKRMLIVVQTTMIQIARNLLNMEMSFADISKVTGLTIEEIKDLK